MSHVVFRPKKLSIQELQEGYLWAQKYTCAPRSILKRLLWGPKHHFLYFVMSNFVLRGAQMEVIRKIKKEHVRDVITRSEEAKQSDGDCRALPPKRDRSQ
jgi:hypothetical protein